MVRGRLFLALVLLSVGGLASGSKDWDQGPILGFRMLASSRGVASPVQSLRQELLETLDRLAAYEGYYRSVYGHYTKILGRTGLSISPRLAEAYDIRVQEASRDRFLILASSERDGRLADFVSVDHLHRVHANFRLPEPSSDYLRQHAERQLRRLAREGRPERFRESGIFQGYFRFDARLNSNGERVAVAQGIAGPVKGLEFELDSKTLVARDAQGTELDWAAREQRPQSSVVAGWKNAAPTTGEHPVPRASRSLTASFAGLKGALEEVYLAQRIFRGETGRYARNWEELARVANFRFEHRGELSSESPEVPFSEGEFTIDLDALSERRPASGLQPPTATEGEALGAAPLIIEPLEESPSIR